MLPARLSPLLLTSYSANNLKDGLVSQSPILQSERCCVCVDAERKTKINLHMFSRLSFSISNTNIYEEQARTLLNYIFCYAIMHLFFEAHFSTLYTIFTYFAQRSPFLSHDSKAISDPF